MRIEKLNENTKKNLLDDLLKRSPNNYGKFEASVQEILNAVKEKGDEAVFEYTEKFDGVRLDAEHLLVTEEEIAEAYEQVDDELIAIIRKALVNIRDYHQKQMQYSWFDSKPDGTILGQKITPLHRVGVYVPGGKAVYQEIEEILASVSTYTAVTVTAIDEKNDFLMAEEKNGKLYAFHKVSEKLRTKSGKQAKLEDLAVGDELTVLSDGRVLLSDPYQIENIYQIYT